MLIVVALSAALLTTTAWKEGTFLSAPVRPTAVRFAIGHQGREPTRMGLGPGLNHATAGQSAGPNCRWRKGVVGGELRLRRRRRRP
jgi:hypothetical protein